MFSKFSRISLIVLITFLVLFTRFYNLDWGQEIFFHPDENNIASLANSLKLPTSGLDFFTKGTFSYGSLTSYLAFWVNIALQPLQYQIFHLNSFEFIIYFLRFLSALCSSVTVLLIYGIVKKNWGRTPAYLALIFSIFSPGLIQSAHFGTFESVLTLMQLLIFACCLEINQRPASKYLFLSSLPLAVASALKINSLIVAPIIVFLYFFKSLNKKNISAKIVSVITFSILVLGLTVILSPYYLTSNFFSMFKYEQQVVLGTLDVFYTRSFINSSPFIFDFTHILPWLISPLFSFLFPVLLVFSTRRSFKNRNILLAFIFLLFVPNALLFTKWTRYLVPLIPYIIILTSVIIGTIKSPIKKYIIAAFVTFQFIWGFSFFKIYFQPDTRISASNWIFQNIPSQSYILSETGNVADLPIYQFDTSSSQYTVKNFDFYNLDFNSTLLPQLVGDLTKSDYIIIPSRRLFANMGRLPVRYPLLSRYYQSLFSGSLGFTQLAQFSSFPGIGSLTISDEFAEETWTVFDHPVIRIFKKTHQLDSSQYEKLLKT